MAFREKNFQTLFTKYAKKNPLPTGLYELKLARKGKFYFSQLEDHQWVFLSKAKHKTLVHKISDSSIGYKPADTVIFTKSNGFVVIMFYTPYKEKIAYIIDIDVLTKSKSKYKSLTEETVKLLSYRTIKF